MAKKLENDNKDKNKKLVEDPGFSVVELDDDADTGMEESDLELDEEGNFVADLGEEIDDDKSADNSAEDTDDEDEEPDEDPDADTEEPDDEDKEPEPEPEVKSVQKNKKLSPETIKLIALEKENRRLKRAAVEKSEAKKSADLVKEYLAQGHDEDTAKRYASQDIQTQRLQTEVELLRFERSNAKVFEKYPQAAERTDEIMQKSKAAGMTAEEVCRGLYGRPSLEREDRAMRAARGESTRTVEPAGPTTARVGKADPNGALSAKDIAYKKELERRFNHGQAMSLDEFSKYRKG